MQKVLRLVAMLVAACAIFSAPLSAATTTPVYSYNLLRGNAGGDTVSPVAGDYQVILGGTYNGATLTLYQTVNSLVTTIATYTSTPGTTPCITIPAGANMQMTVTGGPPSGMTAVLGGVGVGGCGSGSGTGDVTGPGSSTNGNFPSFNGTGGKTLQDSAYSPSSFAPAGVVTVVTGSNPTTNAASWSAFTQYTIGGSGRTITVPASSGLSTNGGLFIDANTNSVTLAANAADTITYSGATTGTGGSVTLPAGGMYVVTTDAAGKLYVSGRAVQGNGLKTQLSTGSTTTNNCVKFDANGNTVDAGAACSGGQDGSLNQSVIATYWYWTVPGLATNNGSGLGSGTVYYRPFYVGTSHTIGAIGAYLVTASAGGNCAFAIYANSGSTNRPTGSALASVSGVSTATAGPIHGNVSLAVTKGNWYWDAILCDNTTVTFTGNAGSGGLTDNWMVGSSSEANMNGNSTNHYNQFSSGGATYPTFPSSPTVADNGQTANRTPIFYHQIASVP